MTPDNIFLSNERTNTSQFIKDVDFAFKGAQSFRWNIFYWFLHILFVVFFIIRGIIVNNTPAAVHIPRIEYVNEQIPGAEHYQFMNGSKDHNLYYISYII